MEDILDGDIHEVDFSDDQKREELKIFVGDKFGYYFSKWIMFENGKWVSFNVAAFFLGLMWLLYRKMYLEVGIILGLFLVEGIIIDFIFVIDSLNYQIANLVSSIVYAILIPLSANYLYLKSAERKIAKLKTKAYSQEELLERISEKGGTSIAAVFLYTTLCIAALLYAFT